MPHPFPSASGTSLDETLGIDYEEVTAERVVATMPVGPRVHQPLGYLHGGASIVLAESAASVGANVAALPERVAFGLEVNASHLRPKREGTLRATATPIRQGRTTAVWDVRVEGEDGKLICASRITLALVPAQDRA
ncbi:MAG TPA: hotdog fold thioesterase [Bacteroidetes bacterium]|nr:hotdog fold thioesterase [Bacteroidota bacterium]HIL58766.1 hotdog fold thioesterase [Rhodothermales bacterium]